MYEKRIKKIQQQNSMYRERINKLAIQTKLEMKQVRKMELKNNYKVPHSKIVDIATVKDEISRSKLEKTSYESSLKANSFSK